MSKGEQRSPINKSILGSMNQIMITQKKERKKRWKRKEGDLRALESRSSRWGRNPSASLSHTQDMRRVGKRADRFKGGLLLVGRQWSDEAATFSHILPLRSVWFIPQLNGQRQGRDMRNTNRTRRKARMREDKKGKRLAETSRWIQV